MAVAVVALLAVAGLGIAWVGSDETEAVTSESPVASVTGDVETVFYSTIPPVLTMTQKVARGTYFNITNTQNGPWEYLIKGINGTATTVGSSSEGLTHTASGVSGILNTNLTTLTIEWEAINDIENVDEEYSSVFTVVNVESSQSNPWTSLNLPASIFWDCAQLDYNRVYVNVGSPVTISKVTNYDGYTSMVCLSVSSGYGLSVSNGTLTGTVNAVGTVDVVMEMSDSINGSISEETFYLVVSDYNHADVRMIGGETWTYTPSTNMASVVSISGTATAWVSLTGGTVSGTAPTNTSVGQTYDLTITANSTQPSQTITQTVTFTVDPQITITASSASQTILYGTGSVDIISSNFEDGTRSVYSLTAGPSGYSINGVSGVISYTNPNSGTVTITATSPYTYTSGATNSASTTVTFDVQGRLSASTSGTLYLVTGGSVPNTPAEAVTLSHSDVGTGTYTWAVTGANTSGVTVASDGTIGGTPGAVGTYAVTVTCTSVVGGTTQTADTTLNIVIVAVLAFTSSPSQGTVS